MPRLVVELPPDAVKKGEAEIRRALQAIGVDAEVLSKKMLSEEAAAERAARGFSKLAAQYDPTAKKVQELARAQTVLDAALTRGKITQDQYDSALAKVRSRVVGLAAEKEKARAALERLTAQLDPAVRKTQELAAAQRTLDQAYKAGLINQAEHSRFMGQAQAQFGNVRSAALSLQSLLPGVFSAVAVKSFVRELITAQLEIDQIKARLRVATGGSEPEAGREFAFVREEAKRLGLDLKLLAKEYSSLAVASRGTNMEGKDTRNIFIGIATEAAALGLNQQQVEKAFKAVQQMMSKGTVTAEELRGQLGDALPDAMQLFARALDVTVPQLNEMLKNGEVLAADTLPKVAAEMQKAYGAEAEANAKRLGGALNQVNTVLFDLKATLASAGIGEAIRDQANTASTAIDGLLPLLREADRLSREWGGKGLLSNLASSPAMLLAQGAKRTRDAFRDTFAADDDYGPNAPWEGVTDRDRRRIQVSAMERATRATTGGSKLGKDGALEVAAMDDAFDGLTKSQEEASKAAEQLVSDYKALHDRLSPVSAAATRFEQGLVSIKARMGSVPAQQLIADLAALRVELDEATKPREFVEPPDFSKQSKDIRKVGDALETILKRLGGEVDIQKELNSIVEEGVMYIDAQTDATGRQIDKATDLKETWLAVADAISASLQGSEWEETINSVLQVAEAWRQVATAQEGAAGAQQRAAGYAGIAQGIGNLGNSLGLWGAKGGISVFGASKDSNYAKEGQAVGAVAGAIIGGAIAAYFTGGMGTVQGAQAGAAIGGVLGEVIGSAIKHGAAEGLAKIELTAKGVGVKITKGEEGLGSIIGDIGQQIVGGLNQALAVLDAELVGLPNVGIKVRGDTVSVTVGAIRAKFKSVDEAIAFAMAEVLKQGELAGNLSNNVKTAIENSMAGSLDDLVADIEFAQFIDNIGLSEVSLAFDSLIQQFRGFSERAKQLGLDANKLGEWLGQQLGEQRNDILGIVEDPKAAVRRKVAAFNADLAILRAEQTAKVAEQQFKRAALQADIAMLRASAGVAQSGIEVKARVIEADYAVASAQRGLLQIKLQELAALDQAIALSIAALESLPAEITGAEEAAAIARASRGGRGGLDNWKNITDTWADGVKEFRETIKALKFNEATTALTLEERVRLADAEYQRLQARAFQTGDVDALQQADDALALFLELYKTFTGGGQGFLGDFRDVFEDRIGQAEENLARPRPGRIRDGNVVFDRRFHETQQEHVRESRVHRQQAREDMRALTQTIERGNQQQRDLALELRRNRSEDYEVRRTG